VWLLPLFSPLARAAGWVYYRLAYAGDPVPRTGPVLLVANHPNSLLDPTLVVAAAGRPVRFLAKSPLFTDRKIGWLVRASGAIPVYRRADDPGQMERNQDAFSAVWDALADGAAVGIFPEGTSHSEPAMVPLRTGASRIALGAAERLRGAFPILPVGLVFRQKDTFRSEAMVLRGRPVAWDDLAARGLDDAAAVRELTARIDAALRGVTLNLASWEDRPVVEGAVQVWEAEQRTASAPGVRLGRLELTTHVLRRVRQSGDETGLTLARDLSTHLTRLGRLGLTPGDLSADVALSAGARWAARRLYLFMPFAALLAVAGAVPFWIPYRATGVIVDRLRLEEDVRSTWKLLLGIVLYALWLAMLVLGAGLVFGATGALLCLMLVPAVALAGLRVRERWASAWSDVRRFFLIRSRRDMIGRLRERQSELARRLQQMLDRHQASVP
jgi:1-acyl-sn-glycerol-3-phosphate acyltransferase